MEQIKTYFDNITRDEEDHARLVTQIKDILTGDGEFFVLYGTGAHGSGKTTLVKLLFSIVDAVEIRNYIVTDGPRNYFYSSPSFLSADYLLVRELDFEDLDASKLTKLVHPQTVHNGVVKKKKLIIESLDDPQDSILSSDNTLRPQSRFIEMNKDIQNPDYHILQQIKENYLEEFKDYILGFGE